MDARTDARTLAAASGVAAIVLAAACIGGAVLVAPWFSWTGNALSDLGASDGLAAPLFNYGLVAAGALGLPFAWLTWRERSNPAQAAGALLFAAALVSLAGVGLFPSGTALHAPSAIGFYALFTYGLFAHGTGSVHAGDVAWGIRTVWLGVAQFTVWLVWVLVVAVGPSLGLALPEVGGAAVVGTYVVTTARRATRRGRRSG